MTTVDVSAAPRPARPRFVALALKDLIFGLTHWRLWATMGWLDVRQRYRRSVIGPFWITLSLGISVGGLGVVYSTLFHQNISEYLPFVATGFVVWNLISSLMTDSCQVFISADATIKQYPFPLSNYVYRVVWRNLIVLAHNFVIYLAVIAIFGINPGWGALWALPGLVIVTLTGFGFGLFFGTLSARFRDIPQLVSNLMQVVFFITPLLWKQETLGARAWVAEVNPFTYMLQVIRAPLLGQAVTPQEWAIASAFCLVTLLFAFALFLRYRWRIPYWL